ncbi:uncharacterized protein LOC136032638 [Artemia franciscana]|uniref:uncharacterized protein LOC136032638 n=1 Tax=Artemia franciscana TaxID=6661 RepID=UPI0032DAF2E7
MEEFEVIVRQNSIPVIAATETWNLDRLSGHMAGYEIFLSTRADRDPTKWHNAVKKVAGQAFDSSVKISNDGGSLINTEEVSEFFTNPTSTTYPTITAHEKSTILEKFEPENNIIVSEFDVYTELRNIKPNTSSYPGELPAKLLREYAGFIALPLSSIINECFASGFFPSQWKRAYIRIIPKKCAPSECDDLRPISLTPCSAKVTEAFILKFLLKQIHGRIDKFQYGGLPECSTTIYLVRMFDCVLQWLEKGSCFVDICVVDFRKAFHLIRHRTAGMNLQEMGAKRRTLGLVLDFLTGRKQKVFALHENDSDSSWSDTSCGAPQVETSLDEYPRYACSPGLVITMVRYGSEE